MGYEQYRNEIIARLTNILPTETVNKVMHEIDDVSTGYTVERACTDLIPVGMPEVVKAYIASMAVENCKRSTLNDYRIILNRFFRHVPKPYNTIVTNDVRQYLFNQQTEKNWKPETMEHHRVVINAFFGWLVDNEYLSRNPARQIRPARLSKHKLKPLQQIELERFRDACETDRERALVDFLFATGCRVTEASNVTLSDINWTDRSVLIRHGKGDKERVTYFNAEAELSIQRYIKDRKGDDDHLFVAGRYPYVKLSRESLEADIRRIRNRIPEALSIKVTPHTFRRTMGTMAVRHGCPIEQVKELLGHVSLDTTMQYVTVMQDDVRTSHSKYLA